MSCSPVPCGAPGEVSITSYNIFQVSYKCWTSSVCSTVCSSSLFSTCIETCAPTTQLIATYYTSLIYISINTVTNGVTISSTGYTTDAIAGTSTSVNVNSANCQSISTVTCSSSTTTTTSTGSSSAISPSSVVIYPVPVVIAAAAAAVALGARAGTDDDEGPNGGAQTPMNELSIPVTGADFRDDGCGDTVVRFTADGQCHPLLRRGPCPDPFHWVTVSSINFTVNE